MPHRQPYRIALQDLQSQRLRRDHADLAAEPQYRQVAEFFFNELYGPRDFSDRDEQAQRLKSFIHYIPGVMIHDVDQVLDLLALTNRLDESVIVKLIEFEAGADFDEEVYERAYRAADNYDERLQQIELVRASMYKVHRLTNKPLLGIALERTGALAAVAGLAEIHSFLRIGYQAVRPVRDIHRFVETICVREERRLNRIYADHLAERE
jgi:hypothetical protein